MIGFLVKCGFHTIFAGYFDTGDPGDEEHPQPVGCVYGVFIPRLHLRPEPLPVEQFVGWQRRNETKGSSLVQKQLLFVEEILHHIFEHGARTRRQQV